MKSNAMWLWYTFDHIAADSSDRVAYDKAVMRVLKQPVILSAVDDMIACQSHDSFSIEWC